MTDRINRSDVWAVHEAILEDIERKGVMVPDAITFPEQYTGPVPPGEYRKDAHGIWMQVQEPRDEFTG